MEDSLPSKFNVKCKGHTWRARMVNVVEPSILHWLKSDLPSFEVIRQLSLFKQYKIGRPSSIPEDLDKPNCLGSTYTAGTHEGIHNNDYNTQNFYKHNHNLIYKTSSQI